MANSIAKLLDSFFDNKMEDFETAFPAAIESDFLLFMTRPMLLERGTFRGIALIL